MSSHNYIFLLILVGAQFKVAAQDAPTKTSTLIKLGGFYPGGIARTYESFLINLEVERSFRKVPAFTHGARVDYDYKKRVADNLSIGYQIKAYPFYFLKRAPYNGLFFGGELCYNLKLEKYTIAGPGLAGIMGYQRTIKDRFLLGGEIRTSYVQNLNSDFPEHNPEHRYFFFTSYVKFGIRLNSSR